ncbi:tubulin polyglutamylase complex subunit 2 [Gracilinanus agilis]|uniref:tubulin polyglutamylase complex subunit 2 n=1 Tax=Gracilinanus agilis TaxID=191870 RepID=UPI001CFD8071|nr:tubulin polyglutamylase complex subunit 2 [Gracilinanus agilis]
MEDRSLQCLGGNKPHLEKLTLGVARILEASPGVTGVSVVEREPADIGMITAWEQENDCILPDDLRNFYLMTNGFHMLWNVKLDNYPVPLGSLMINSLMKLNQLHQSSVYLLPNSPSLGDLEEDEDEVFVPNGDDPEKPHFDSRNRIFELDSCSGNGKVCLVYKKDKPDAFVDRNQPSSKERSQFAQVYNSDKLKEKCGNLKLSHLSPQDSEIWFLDRALYWHFLSDSFTTYYRLLITHLGLPQWQYAFTSYGISPQAKQWFNMYKPITYNTAVLAEDDGIFMNKLDPSKVFKSKSKTLVSKKRSSLQSSSSQRGSSASPVIKSSPIPGNSIRK